MPGEFQRSNIQLVIFKQETVQQKGILESFLEEEFLVRMGINPIRMVG